MICSINMLHSVSLTVLLFQSMLGSIVRIVFALLLGVFQSTTVI